MFNFVKKNNKKIIVSLISVMIVFFGLTFLVRKENNSLTERDRRLLTYDQYQTGDELIDGADYITFDAYFYEKINGTSTKIRGQYLNIKDNAELWLDLHVYGDAELKDAKIELVNGNVKTSGYLYKNSIIPSNMNVPNGGTITLKPSIQGATLNHKIAVSANLTNDLNSLSNSTNKVILTGTAILPDGTEKAIRKEVNYTVDWYLDDVTASIGIFKKSNQSFPYREVFGCESPTLAGSVKAYYHEWTGENYKLTFDLTTTSNSPFLKSANIEVKIPKLNGYDPLSVTMNNYGITYNYDQATRTLTATKEATLDGTLLTQNAYSYRNNGISYNDWTIYVEYPKEVEENSETMMFSTKTWYEEYRYNTNSQVEVNSSNTEEKTLTATFIKPTIRKESSLDCGQADRVAFGRKTTIGSYSSLLRTYYINKTGALKKYNNEDGATDETNYSVYWETYINYFDRYDVDTLTSVTLNDNSADYANSNYTLDGISKYKSIKVYNAGYWLGSSGYIKIIDNKTGEVIHILTALDWNDYYTFDTDVSSIRLVTSEIINRDAMAEHALRYGWQDTNLLTFFNVSIIKTIDHAELMNKYNLETFNSMSYVGTNFKIDGVRHRTEENTDQQVTGTNYYNSASLRTMQSATVEISSNKNSIDSTSFNDVRFTISTGEFHDIVEGYKDAEFLIVLPDWMLDLDINSVSINTNSVKITGYEKVDLGNGRKGIRIVTANDTNAKYDITVNTTITPDARKMNSSGSVLLYATNPGTNVSSQKAYDTYDVDQDGITDEYQNYASKAITLVAPNEIITTTTINYKDVDENGVTVVSPMIADINPLEDHTDAQIEIGITNNSLYPTQDFTIIGKIGFVGNTYQIGDGELGSEFDVKMTSNGIAIPEELAGKVTIYYSDKPTPTDDLNDSANNWKLKEDVTDFNAVKTYMIIVDDYTLPVGKNMTFTYDIEMPNTTANLNQKTYFTHGVYYNINTGDAGLLPSNVGGAKLGINMARRYDLSLTNYKIASNRTIANTKYTIVAKDNDDNIIDSKLLTTDANGNAIAKNLYAGLTYEIVQTNVKLPYVLDEETKKFTLTNGENDVLSLTTEGSIKSANLVNNHLVSIDLENETRYDITIKNTDFDTDEVIPFATFKITGKGYEDGKEIRANQNGELFIKNLYLDELYMVEQIKVNDYLRIEEKFTIKLTRDTDGVVKITVKKVATIGDPVTIGDYGYKYYSGGGYYEPTRSYNGKHTAAYFPIDFKDFTDVFTIKLGWSFYSRYSAWDLFKLYLTDNITDLDGLSGATPFVSYGYNPSYGKTEVTPTTYNAYDENTNTYTVKQIEADKQYYLYADYFYRGYAMYGYVYKPTFTNSAGLDYEYLIKEDTQDVAVFENKNVTQTIQDSDNQDSPVLTVKVKNAKIPKYTLKLTKQDAETHVPLAGAQYKITGPGLPASGKYLTTDENGHAEIELYKGISNRKYINGFNYSQYQSKYTIEEVLAPVGYTLDSTPVKFSGILTIQNGQETEEKIYLTSSSWTYNYVTDLATEKDNQLSYDILEKGRFKEATWDNDNNELNVVMHDFPIISVTKKDAETGEVLPNTLFAIYKIEKVAGNNVFVPATDTNGNIVGNEIVIDGKTYYAVATNEAGKLNLNLGTGQYKLIEVQAADDKYSLDDNEYYFGIGETVPYQAAGVEIVDTYTSPNNYFYDQSYSSHDKIKPTSDGGWIMMSYNRRKLYKYDKDFNLEWETQANIFYSGTAYEVTYFDDPDRKEMWYSSPSEMGMLDVVETSDGGFIILGNYYGIFVKYDKYGNKVWQNEESYYYAKKEFDKVCTYEGNTEPGVDDKSSVIFYVNRSYYQDDEGNWVQLVLPDGDYNYNSETGELVNESITYHSLENPYEYTSLGPIARRDDDTYYCHYKNYGEENTMTNAYNVYYQYNTPYSYINGVLPLENGHTLLLFNNSNRYREDENYNTKYYFRYKDGTEVKATSYDTILEYDEEGDIVDIYDFDEMVLEAEQQYMEKYGLTESWLATKMNTNYELPSYNFFISNYFNFIRSYPNGDILIILSNVNIAVKLRKNATTNKYEIVQYVPIGYNGYQFYYGFYDYHDGDFDIKLLDDGGFVVNYYSSYSFGPTTGYYSYNPYFDTELQHTSDELNEKLFYRQNNYGYPLFEFNSDGKLDNIVIMSTTYRYSENGGGYGEEDVKHIYGNLAGWAYERLDDGSYIVGTGTDSLYTYNDEVLQFTDGGRKFVLLANGEFVFLDSDTTYILYKINPDGYVEWVKQYKGIAPTYNSSSSGSTKMRSFANGKKILLPVTINGKAYEAGKEDEPLLENYSGQAFLIIELKDEVQPSGPEQYTLEIENKRKEYKIIATSNLGGTITVTDPDGNEEVINNGTLETVKYGDDNVNTITIKPDQSHVVLSVTVNGEDASFKVNDDGSVTLNTIKDIRETKNVNVTYENGMSTVVVKHYLKDTTDSVFGDEILTGKIDVDTYTATPKSSDLYSVVEENGEIILPDNITGTFKPEQQTVIFYYQENEVELRTHYYIDGTSTELAPTDVQRKVIGSHYQSAPINITNYEYTRSVGDTEGTLDDAVTEVTHMYRELTNSTITIRYVDKATGTDIIEPITKTVDRHSQYTTDDPVTIPSNYRFTNIAGNPSGTADDAVIEVIYYYEVIPFNISVDKKINSVLLNGEKQTITNGKNVSISPKKKDSLIVYYEIDVKNTGDIKATFKVVEGEVPGFVIYDQGLFTKSGNDYVLDVELEPGEEKTYKIGYKWNQKDYGISTNKVEVKEVENPNGFAEPDPDDNESTATVETKIPKEVLDDVVVIPNTIDNIKTIVMLFITSIIGIITSIILIRRKRMN